MKEEKLLLRPNRLKTVALGLISLVFIFGGYFMIEDKPFMGWLTMLFFGLCFLVFIVMLIPNSSHLELTSEGFEVKNLFRSDLTKWTDVETFRVGYAGRTKIVMFDYTEGHKKYKTGKSIAKSLSGSEGALPNTYGLSAKELAKLMNQWKSKTAIT